MTTNATGNVSQPVYITDPNGNAAPLYPVTYVTASSGVVANATAAATLPAVASRTTYLTGFDITGTGATAGLAVAPTVTGVISGPLTYTYAAAVGALLQNSVLSIRFNPPIPSSALNTAITVSCPALGLGNTNNAVNVFGYYA